MKTLAKQSIKPILTKVLVTSVQKNTMWHLGNQTLYDLCQTNFRHKDPKAIVAKTWLIGRAYSVALERRRNNDGIKNEQFYTHTLVNCFANAKLDERLSKLKTYKALDRDVLKHVLETHQNLTLTLNKVTGLNKRSFSSKYLHFHLPDLFFIYDSRAVFAMKQLKELLPITTQNMKGKFDGPYQQFTEQCVFLTKHISDELGILLSPRQLDNLLLIIADGHLVRRVAVRQQRSRKFQKVQ